MMIIPVSGITNPEFINVENGVYAVKFFIKNEVGSTANILIPMLSEDALPLQDEVQLGYTYALEQSDIFWAKKDPHAATVKVPEKYITNVINKSVKFAQINAEIYYEKKEYSYLTGSFGYDYLWATPTSMLSHMFMDPLGQFRSTKKYSEIFLKIRVQ